MNNDLISRKEVLDEINRIGVRAFTDYASYSNFFDFDDTLPTVERLRGEWIGDTNLDNTCKCSECRMTFDTDRLKMVMCDGKYELPPCCPNCGVEMRGGKQ